ncbi:MAG: PAS domain S-box protein, partial [Oscillospiraceae bacterium]|nr:PAS domain S-box protein [Oscillospiraceae bacterium]
MTKKIFRSILTVAMAVLLAGVLIITSCLYDYFDGVQEDQLRDELNLAAIGTEQLGEAYLEQLNEKSGRLTWVDADGTVLYDTQVDAGTMENHADREEIREALETGTGSSNRFSITLVEETLYEAKALSDGTVLRISVSRATAMILVLGMLSPILAVCALAMILSAVLANRMAKRVVEPLNGLDLEHPLENDTYEELAPLLGRIHAQHQQIRTQLSELQRKQDEFEQITGNMKEGLILLDSKGTILSINPAARELFQADRNCVGQDFLTVDRAHDVSSAIQKALADGHSQVRTRRNGRDYQLDLSRIQSAGKTQGTVLLAFDVTEQAQAEQRRREFTANVSHELKTPLQSIMGSAELIETGLVKTEDMPRFLGHIRKEASRLVTLIEDIIRLSQLDEGGDLPREEISLLELAEDAQASLQERA